MVQDAPASSVPAWLAELAAQHGWPVQMVEQALRLGLSDVEIGSMIETGMTVEEAVQLFTPKFDWLDVPTERGLRVAPDERGLTLGALNVGSYGRVPDRWPYDTFLPRGAAPPSERQVGLGYTIFDKVEVWSEEAAELYEEAIAQRWVPARDIPWETLAPLPDELERAMCQVCTEMAQRAAVWHVVVGGWLPRISYGFHEIKVLLATEVFAAGRLYEAFRKRALANGGGLGVESPGVFFKRLTDPRTFLEMSLSLHLIHATFSEVICRYGESCAALEADRRLFAFAARDLGRFAAYGVGHLRYLLDRDPGRRPEVEAILRIGEQALVRDEEKNLPFREAMVLLLGVGLENAATGWRRLSQLREEQVRLYLARLAEAGLSGWEEHLHRTLRSWLRGD
jgi:hypothetical protein